MSVCPADTNEPPRLLNYLTAPNALVWSAVAASSAFPGLFPPQHLLARNSNGEMRGRSGLTVQVRQPPRPARRRPCLSCPALIPPPKGPALIPPRTPCPDFPPSSPAIPGLLFCCKGEIVTFSADCGDSGVERRWRDGSLELDLPAKVWTQV